VDEDELNYIRGHYRGKTVREIARALNVSRRQVEEEIGRLSRTASPEPAVRLWAPKHVAALLAVLAVTAAVYARALSFPFINWDDTEYVVQNPDIRELSLPHLKKFFTRTYAGLYAPLSMVSLALDYQLYRFNAAGFHATNLALHLFNLVLVFIIVLKLTGDWTAAAGAALVFGVHPVQTESVVWISQRKNVLSFAFYLASFCCHLARPRRPALYGALGFVLFVLACLAKPLAVTLPLLMAAYDHAFGRPLKKEILYYVPFFVFAAAMAALSVAFSHVPAAAHAAAPSRLTTLLTGQAAMMKYFQLVFIPMGQSIRYPFGPYAPLDPRLFFSALGTALSLAGLYMLHGRNKKLFFWGAWYFILLAPVLNIIPMLDFMQDRWLYLPLVGIYALVFLALRAKAGTRACVALAVALGVVFSALNLKRQDVWADPEALWTEAQKSAPQGWSSPYFNLGMHYVEQGKPDLAIPEFEKAAVLFHHAGAYRGLGNIYAQKREFEKAAGYYQKALEIEPNTPIIHNSLGFLYASMGQYDKALAAFDKAAQLDPQRPEIQANRGRALALLGRLPEAEQAYQAALKLDPDSAETLMNYAGFLAVTGRPDQARAAARKFLTLHPDSPLRPQVESILASLDKPKPAA